MMQSLQVEPSEMCNLTKGKALCGHATAAHGQPGTNKQRHKRKGPALHNN